VTSAILEPIPVQPFRGWKDCIVYRTSVKILELETSIRCELQPVTSRNTNRAHVTSEAGESLCC